VDDHLIDRDLLAKHLQGKVEQERLSLRQAADEIGCSLATLSRLLKGSEAPSIPDSITLLKAASWLRKSIADFETGKKESDVSSLTDVELHMRALPGIAPEDREALVAMVKAAYDAAHQLRAKKE
jgi:transcriptional regulator with XRE-family HTH domain